MPQTSDSPSDTDLKRGYTVNAAGEIILLRPLPPGDLSDLFDRHPGQMVDLQVQQVELEIARPLRPVQRSRQSQTPNGYIHLVAWSNACLLRILMTAWFRRYRVIHGYNKGFYRNLKEFKGIEPDPALPDKFLQNPVNSSKSPLNSFTPAGSPPLTSPKSPLNSSNFIPSWLNPKLLDRLEAQLLDSLRSVIANIEEGFARPTTVEYLNFLGYTQASLKEAKGDVQRMKQDGLLASKPGSQLADLGIDLAAWHTALKKSVISAPPLTSSKFPINSPKGAYRNLKQFPLNPPKSPLNSYNFGYAPVDNLNPAELTYEMLIELINKTDWNLQQLVGSLETKLNSGQKAFH